METPPCSERSDRPEVYAARVIAARRGCDVSAAMRSPCDCVIRYETLRREDVRPVLDALSISRPGR